MSTALLKADYVPIEEICVGVSGNQVRPDIDGDIVIWEDGLDVYWLSLSDPNKVQHSIVIGGIQDYASVGGQSIVWRDKNTDYDIGIYDVQSDTNWILSSNDGATQRYPEASAQYIICEDNSGESYNVAVYDDQTDAFVRIAPSSALQTNLAIDGSLAVWRDDRDNTRQIYLCDLSVTPYAPHLVCASDFEQWRPVISGNIVVWQDHAADPDINLVAYDISRQEIVWSNTETTEQTYPSISNGIIVWQERPVGSTNGYDIRGYDLNTGAWLDIATGNEDDQMPVISGRMVVWQRNGTDIVGVTIPTPMALVVTTPNDSEQFLAGSQMTIAWEMTEGTLPDEVKIEFSSDNGQSWQVVEPNVPADVPYTWKPVADVDSQQCKIQVSAVGDAAVYDVSEVFTVFQCSHKLTADVTGDCVVDMNDFAVLASQWMACGNPYDENWCFE